MHCNDHLEQADDGGAGDDYDDADADDDYDVEDNDDDGGQWAFNTPHIHKTEAVLSQKKFVARKRRR